MSEIARPMTVSRRIKAFARSLRTYLVLRLFRFLVGAKFRENHRAFVYSLEREIRVHRCSLRVFWENHQYNVGDVVHCYTKPGCREDGYIPQPVYFTVEKIENGFLHGGNSRRTHHGLRLSELINA